MKPTQSSSNAEKRIVTWLIIIAVTASLLVWLLCKLDFPLTPMLARTLIAPMP